VLRLVIMSENNISYGVARVHLPHAPTNELSESTREDSATFRALTQTLIDLIETFSTDPEKTQAI